MFFGRSILEAFCMDFGLPNPSQDSSLKARKSMSQKTCDFSSIFVRKMLGCTSADIDFVLVFTIQNACRTIFFESLFACIFGAKNLPKSSPKPLPNPLKIGAKNASFFNIDFFLFWTRFCKLLGLQIGAKSAALLAAPGVLDPTAFYACIHIMLFLA